MRIVACVFLALALAGCASTLAKLEAGASAASTAYSVVSTASVTQSQAKGLHDSIALVQKGVDAYLEEPTCSPATQAGTACKGLTTAYKVSVALRALRSTDDTLSNAIVAAQSAGTGVGVASTVYNEAVNNYNVFVKAYNTAKGTQA